jgi:hypothetical protein
VSCIATSKPALDNIIPVKPPIVNNTKNPKAKSKGVLYISLPPQIVANQLNILIPVGTAIIIVAAIK